MFVCLKESGYVRIILSKSQILFLPLFGMVWKSLWINLNVNMYNTGCILSGTDVSCQSNTPLCRLTGSISDRKGASSGIAAALWLE